LISDIPAGDGKMANSSLQCTLGDEYSISVLERPPINEMKRVWLAFIPGVDCTSGNFSYLSTSALYPVEGRAVLIVPFNSRISTLKKKKLVCQDTQKFVWHLYVQKGIMNIHPSCPGPVRLLPSPVLLLSPPFPYKTILQILEL
jgi:hypothetical protein